MNTKMIAILGIAAVLAIAVAALITRNASAEGESGLFFPDLEQRINDVAHVHVQRAGGEFTIERTGETWQLVEKGGYPVRLDRIRETIVGMADLRAPEPMTSNPERYARIGIQDVEHAQPDEPGGPSLLTLKDDSGETLARAIIGNSRYGARQGVYIRRPGEEQSWLAQGRLEIPGQFTNWIDPQIMSIPRDRIQSVQITPADGQPFSVERQSREERNFAIIGLPEGKEVNNTAAIDAFGSALSFLSLEDVAPAGTIDFSGSGRARPAAQLEFRTFDGLLLIAHLADHDGRTWARFAAAPDPQAEPDAQTAETIAAEAAQLSARLEPWAFGLPPYKASVMKITVEDLLRDGRPIDLPASMQEEGVETLDLSQPGQPGGVPVVPGER